MAHVNRSARTGKFVDDAEAIANPNETVTETVRTGADREAEIRALVDAFVSELADRFTRQEREAMGFEWARVEFVVRRFGEFAAYEVNPRD